LHRVCDRLSCDVSSFNFKVGVFDCSVWTENDHLCECIMCIIIMKSSYLCKRIWKMTV